MSGSLFSRACLRPTSDHGHVDAGAPHHLGQGANVLALVGIGHGHAEVVLIFHLHHDDRAAHRHLVLHDDGENFRVPVLRGPQALRIGGAKGEALGRHPGRKSSAFPFRADIGARTDDHHETHLVNEFDEFFKLREVHFAFLRLVIIPEDVGFNGVESRQLEFLQAIAPERLGTAGIMKRAAHHQRILAINGETLRVVANELRILKLHLPGGQHGRHGLKTALPPGVQTRRQGRGDGGQKKITAG